MRVSLHTFAGLSLLIVVAPNFDRRSFSVEHERGNQICPLAEVLRVRQAIQQRLDIYFTIRRLLPT